MQYIENLYKMVSIKRKRFTTIRYEVIYNRMEDRKKTFKHFRGKNYQGRRSYSQSSKGGQPDQFWKGCKTGLKSCYRPSSFRNNLLGWSVLLKKVKNQGFFGGTC